MRVTAKGQVTIPLEIRRKLNISSAAEVEFLLSDDGRVYIVKVKDGAARKRFARLRGVATVKMSTEEILTLTRSES